MIFKFKITSTKNIFSILESYGSDLSPHIVFILKTSGYVSFRILSKITAEKILDKIICLFLKNVFLPLSFYRRLIHFALFIYFKCYIFIDFIVWEQWFLSGFAGIPWLRAVYFLKRLLIGSSRLYLGSRILMIVK